jgi:hypothetical protein
VVVIINKTGERMLGPARVKVGERRVGSPYSTL